MRVRSIGRWLPGLIATLTLGLIATLAPNAGATDDAATREAISRISSLFGAYKANFQKMADLRFK